MTYDEKISAYKSLVEDVQRCDKLDKCNENSKVQLEPCKICDEINLWSYWQGGIRHLDADILLVGQDWGRFNDSNYPELRNIISGNPLSDSTTKRYYELNQSLFTTDSNLCELFETIGIKNIAWERDSRVFFTNFVLCYRTKESSMSRGFNYKWADNCSEYFVRLVNIIEPKVIICLGKSVFRSVMKAADMPMLKKSYNQIIEDGAQKARIGDVICMVFPMAHCGTLGTMNRNRVSKETGLTLQKEDWKKILEYI